jgi:hypothetical protein
MLDDQRREAVVNFLQAEFQGFARSKANGSGSEASQNSAFTIDNAKASVFTTTIDAQNPHGGSVGETSQGFKVSRFQGFKVSGRMSRVPHPGLFFGQGGVVDAVVLIPLTLQKLLPSKLGMLSDDVLIGEGKWTTVAGVSGNPQLWQC